MPQPWANIPERGAGVRGENGDSVEGEERQMLANRKRLKMMRNGQLSQSRIQGGGIVGICRKVTLYSGKEVESMAFQEGQHQRGTILIGQHREKRASKTADKYGGGTWKGAPEDRGQKQRAPPFSGQPRKESVTPLAWQGEVCESAEEKRKKVNFSRGR